MKELYIKVIKRLLDLILSISLIIILSPIFAIISIVIKIDSPGPVLFKQARTGVYGKEFILLKFRSMIENNDVFDFEKGDSITKVGLILRKTSLDEIPQLINIIKGDMTFIGPRPWIRECYNYFTPFQKKRNLVKPGLTGLAQVSGRKDLNILKRIEIDVEYVQRVSLLLDFKILVKTILVVLNSTDNTHNNYTVEDEMRDLKNNYDLYLKESKEDR